MYREIIVDGFDEILDLESCRELKELGFPQIGGGWYWVRFGRSLSDSAWALYYFIRMEDVIYPPFIDYVKAPTVGEAKKWLKENNKDERIIEKM